MNDGTGADLRLGDRTANVGLTSQRATERVQLAVNPHAAGGPELGGLDRIPANVRGAAAPTIGVYDARRLRSQREIIRDVMLSAAECETWLTLGELRALTHYGEASISAQLRHLRKCENGGYELVKRHRDGAMVERPGADGRSECVWEYRIAQAGADSADSGGQAAAAV